MIGDELRSSNDSLETLLALQRREASEKAQRANQRFGLDCGVSVAHGNSSARTTKPTQAVCQDLSVGGCRLLSPRPLQVGDIYWLTFDSQELPSAFARCVRCQLLREDSFEAGLQFFSEINLPNASQPKTATDELVDMI